VRFDLLGEIYALETIASGRGVRDRKRLVREYGRGNWRKLKGNAIIRLENGTVIEAEVHWYEAHGIGRKEIKLKKPT
jgi:hypothetical protein